jgi:aminomuconate-semialdehyde/2-hydroxymuconate-6-semialdehyde dehydrogenase
MRMERILHYIAGDLQPSIPAEWLPNINPATGEVYSEIAAGDAADVERAVTAAQHALPDWSRLPATARADYLEKIAAIVERDSESFALAESMDQGKPLSLARTMDIPRAIANLRFFASAGIHFASEAHATSSDILNYTLRTPVGVVGCISPWNLPLYLFTWKIAPALAAGCTVVAKPSELTPMTAFLLARACRDAGLPTGVLNIVHGLGNRAGQAIVSHPAVAAISFTGGTATGQHIARTAAPMLKKLSLELGGKNPNLVFADCDFEQAVKTSVRAAFTNQGEICLCGSRILVERSLYPAFVEAFVAEVKTIQVGDPLAPATQLGALVSEAHLNKVLSYIRLAEEEGGHIEAGGVRVHLAGRCAQGFFVAPTVITGLGPTCRTNQEEIFGPVVTIAPFDSEHEAITIANGTAYGLAATIWTNHLARAHRVAARINAGIVWVNCWLLRDLRTPFGGMKQSGIGREGGWEALRFFTEARNVCLKL